MTQKTEDPRAESVARIDRPHGADSEPSPPALRKVAGEMAAAAAGESSQTAAHQLRSQAGQLASHLRSRLHDIDKREAYLNARIAQLENESRASRLWLREGKHEFAQREEQLQQQLAELRQRLRELSVEEVSADQLHQTRKHDLERREQELAQREQRMAEGQSRLVEQTESLRVERERYLQEQQQAKDALLSSQQEWEQQRDRTEQEHQRVAADLEQRRADLEEKDRELAARESTELVVRLEELQSTAERLRVREQQLEESELAYSEQVVQLESQRQDFVQQKERAQDDLRGQRHLLEEAKARLDNERTQAADAFAARRERLDRRETVLKELRGEAMGIQRETLEMRLVIEELWSNVCDRSSAVELTRGVSELRRRLSDQFCVEQRDLQQQKATLLEIGSRLDSRQQTLRQQRAELEAWLRSRERTIEEQAARIVAREQELDLQQRRCDEIQQDWFSERRQLQQAIRELRSQLRDVQAPIA